MRQHLLTSLLFLVAGCATIRPVVYVPQPERIEDPAEEVRALILANTVQGCVTEPDVTERMLTVKFVCSNGVGNAVARFDSVDRIVLEESGGWFRVSVLHRDGIEPFKWTSKSLKDITRLADALTALSSPHKKSAPAQKPTSA